MITRWLFLLLVVLLPLQFGWSAALAAPCADEEHARLHGHSPGLLAEEATEADADASGCSHCHAPALNALLGTAPSASPQRLARAVRAPALAPPAEAPAPRPERPQWVPCA